MTVGSSNIECKQLGTLFAMPNLLLGYYLDGAYEAYVLM